MQLSRSVLKACSAAAIIPGVAVVGLPALAGAATVKRVTVVEHADTDVTTDTGKKGDSVGDLLTFANDLYDATDKKKVGTDQGYCVRVVAGASYECTWTALLPGGSVVVQGPFYDTKPSTLAVTGGTGRYRGGRGSMRITALDGGKKYRFAYAVTG
jgi:allene oxide cyclase